ncbi:hypothetical protein B296_00038763 [Ensete ventricosum]|uniref:Uncharacterized protein n=1 Tax=Ensete ventricosum TaxID=4639 RepID=A0A426YTS3_ENSVE|nr:hypothetical protein B296_00038763 [Ensete ventricosum]
MRSYPVRDMIMRRYDQELLGAPLWCTTTRRRAMDPRSEYYDTAEASLRVWSKGARKRRGVRRSLATQKVKCRLERSWTRRSTTVPQRRIYRSRMKGCRCKATDSGVMGLAAPWYHRGRTFMESSIPCSHGGRALVVKGAEEVENAEINSKYQDRAEGQRSRNFIRPMSMGFSSR